jgi:hypothetical protein
MNTYKYAIVSDKYDFLKKPDMYQTSSLTAFLLKKNGFDAYLSTNKLPKEVYDNRCNTLFVQILNSSNAFVTKNAVEFRDCNNVVVYKSKVGRSRKKDFKQAYHEAIRDAFTDPVITGYKFKESAVIKPIVIASTQSKVKREIAKENNLVKKEVVQINYTIYAQPISNGFQLVDTSPKVVYTILRTSTKNVFIIKEKNGIMHLKNTKWIAEFYENGQLIQKELQIKF